MTAPEFKAWGKTPRLNRDIIVTEKIDGTNACVIIEKGDPSESQDGWIAGVVDTDGTFYKVGAQSRKRIITPNADGKNSDNAGFAAWVEENARRLVLMLGEGYHYGEWWGYGIQSNKYDQPKGRRFFSLFDHERYAPRVYDCAHPIHSEVRTVPVLYRGPMDQPRINGEVIALRAMGSKIPEARGRKAEGVIVFHTASRQVYKVLCENDQISKTEAGVA